MHDSDVAQAALVRPRLGKTSLKALPKADGTPWGHHRQASLERLATDQPIDGEGAPKLVAALPSRPNWRQLDLVAQELSEHLPSLRRVRAQEVCDVPDALQQREAQGGRVQALNLGKLLQFRQVCEKSGLSRLVGDQAGLDLVGGEGAPSARASSHRSSLR